LIANSFGKETINIFGNLIDLQ